MTRFGRLSLLLPALLAATARADGIEAGAAKVDITPPLPATYDLLQVATEVAQPLHARVLYLEDEDDRAVLVATDYEGILRTAYEALRAAISEATRVPTDRIVINSNHSHNAPWINLDVEERLAPHGIHQVDRVYFRDVVHKVAQAAHRAKDAKRPVTISAGSARLPELCWNRRIGYVRSEDVERFNAKRDYPIGVTDPTLGLVRIDARDGTTVATLSVYASHYVSAGSTAISSSYSGPAMERIERELGGGCVALFFQGCAGNIAFPAGTPNASPEAVERAGELFAARALPELRERMEPIRAQEFVFRSKRVRLPFIPLQVHGSTPSALSTFAKPAMNASAEYTTLTLADLERKFSGALELYKVHRDGENAYSYIADLIAYGDRLTLARNIEEWSAYDLQALRVGPLCLVFLPGESFIEIALQIRDRSPFARTFVAGYNDLTPVYVPDKTAFEEGGYEVGPWCYSTPETSEVLVREALGLIKGLD